MAAGQKEQGRTYCRRGRRAVTYVEQLRGVDVFLVLPRLLDPAENIFDHTSLFYVDDCDLFCSPGLMETFELARDLGRGGH
jgi:hypothetical protein